MRASNFQLGRAVRERRDRLDGLKIRTGFKENAEERVGAGFAEDVAKPAKLCAENESGKAWGGATSAANFGMGHSTDESGGEFDEAAEESGLGCVNKSTIGGGEGEKMERPAAFVPDKRIHFLNLFMPRN